MISCLHLQHNTRVSLEKGTSMSNVINTTDVRADQLIGELVGVTFAGPRISIPGSPYSGPSSERVHGDVTFTVQDDNLVSEKQLATIVRAIVENVDNARSLTVSQGIRAVRKHFGLNSAAQQDSLIVTEVMKRLRQANAPLPMTEGQTSLGLRLVGALQKGETLGRGQQDLDAAIRNLNPQMRGAVALKFVMATTQGEFGAAMDLFERLCGRFDYTASRGNVGQLGENQGSSALIVDSTSAQQSFDDQLPVTGAEAGAKAEKVKATAGKGETPKDEEPF